VEVASLVPRAGHPTISREPEIGLKVRSILASAQPAGSIRRASERHPLIMGG
jgi:hypothetical protein